MKKLFILAALLFAGPTLAQTTVNQGDASPSTKKGWRIQGNSPDGSSATVVGGPVIVGGSDGSLVHTVATETNGQVKTTAYTSAGVEVGTTAQPVVVNGSVDTGAKNSEVCMTNAAGGTTIPAYAGRRAIEIQNLGPNAIYCTVDGQAPLATGALGRKLDASGGVWPMDAGPNLTIRCIAASAAQTTPACTQVTEVK